MSKKPESAHAGAELVEYRGEWITASSAWWKGTPKTAICVLEHPRADVVVRENDNWETAIECGSARQFASDHNMTLHPCPGHEEHFWFEPSTPNEELLIKMRFDFEEPDYMRRSH